MTWRTARLGDILTASSGGVWGKAPGEDDRDVRVWRVTELQRNGTLNPSSAAHRSVSDRQFSSRELKRGDLLLEKSGGGPRTPVGRVGLVADVPEPSVCSNFMQLMRPDAGVVNSRFLHLYLNHIHSMGGTSHLQVASTNIRNIKASDYLQLSVPLPTLREQEEIVSIVNRHISCLESGARTLSSVAGRCQVFQERLIYDSITGASRGEERSEARLDDVGTHDGFLPTLPSGWTWSRLGDVADVVGGITKDAKKQSDPNFVEVPYLRVANVQRGRLDLDTVSRIRVSPAKAEALRLQGGDVLLNEGGDRDKLARGWVWEGQIEHCIHQNHVFRARVRDPKLLDPYFLSWTVNTIGARWAERNGKQSVNLASISLSMIRRMPVIVPAPGHAVAAVVRMRDALNSFARFREEIARAEGRSIALRRAVLLAAFAGDFSSRVEKQAPAIDQLVGT